VGEFSSIRSIRESKKDEAFRLGFGWLGGTKVVLVDTGKEGGGLLHVEIETFHKKERRSAAKDGEKGPHRDLKTLGLSVGRGEGAVDRRPL